MTLRYIYIFLNRDTNFYNDVVIIYVNVLPINPDPPVDERIDTNLKSNRCL